MHSRLTTNSFATGADAKPPLDQPSHQPYHNAKQQEKGGMVLPSLSSSPSHAGAITTTAVEGDYAALGLPLSHPLSSDDGTKDGSSSPSMSSTSRTTSSSAPFLSLAEQTFTPLSMESEPDLVDSDARHTSKHFDDTPAPQDGGDATDTNHDLDSQKQKSQDPDREMAAHQLPQPKVATATPPPHQATGDQELHLQPEADAKNSEPGRGRISPSNTTTTSTDDNNNNNNSNNCVSFTREHNASSETLLARPRRDPSDRENSTASKNIPARYRRERPGPANTEALISNSRATRPLSPERTTSQQQQQPTQPTQPLRGNDSGVSDLANAANTTKKSPPDTKTTHHLINSHSSSSHETILSSPSPSRPSSIISHLQQQLLEEQKAHEIPTCNGFGPPIRRPQPLVRTTSDNIKLAIRHPAPDINLKSTVCLENIAQLEATAERLSLTSSIEDAIRDLHTELKRSDSRRSSILAARVRSSSNSESETDNEPPGLTPASLSRQLSTASSISRNSAARQGGNKASPSHSIKNRLRSGSKTGTGQFEMDFESYLSRNGPGKSSVRSIHSHRLKLAEIAESEPISLTQEALDEADRSNITEEDDDTIRPQRDPDQDQATANQPAAQSNTHTQPSSGPSTDSFHAMLEGTAWQEPAPELRLDGRTNAAQAQAQAQAHPEDHDPRPTTADSYATWSETSSQNPFKDFDGVYCEPDVFMPPPHSPAMPSPAMPSPAQHAPVSPPRVRPQSYLDPETGQQMLYYPARVPMMLNLPPKLSKKPKAKVHNERRSKVLSALPQVAQQAAPWLPDPLEGSAQSPFSHDSFEESPTGPSQPSPAGPSQPSPRKVESPAPEPSPGLPPDIQITQTPDEPTPAAAGDEDEVQPAVPRPRPRNSQMMDAEVRKSRMTRYDNLPPQLRASVYFDLGNSSPDLKIKDGSATATLDTLLDASAHAPVSAFTDHAIAGKLGSEVYGPSKKQRSKSGSKHELGRPTSSGSATKKRGTFFHRSKKSVDVLDDDRRNTITSASQVTPTSLDEEPLPKGAVGYATLSPDTDEFEYIEAEKKKDKGIEADDEDTDDDGDGVEDDEEYHGPPTTLLAELQIRKQQQKNRTRPINNKFPNGMHTTLLELDAVAETQRVSRKGKKVNLAWEDMQRDGLGDEGSDEDVPLGVLYAAKTSGARDLDEAVAELNRPLGLMERREMEDNEPLSHRRARLQNSDPRNTILTKRQTMMLNVGAPASNPRLSHVPSMANMGSPPVDDEEEEVEGETLGERMRRLKAKEEEDLPQARPISAAFTSELLDQFKDPEEEKRRLEAEEAEKAKNVTPVVEEEETLGQRRRRLQAEKEARERELGYGGDVAPAVPRHGALQGRPGLSSRLSMAGILGAHPKRDTSLEDQERRRMEEEQRYLREHDQKMASMRMQMPTTLHTPSFSNNSGAFLNGAFNDGTGGAGIRRVPSPSPHNLDPMIDPFANPRASTAFSNTGLIQQAGTPSMRNPYGAQSYNGATGAGSMNSNPYGGQMQMGMGMPMMGMQMAPPMQMGMGHQMGMGMGMGMQQQQQQQAPTMPMQMGAPVGMNMGMGVPQGQPTDMIDRWRQSVVP